MSTEEFNDDMHRIIVDRLRERNRKLKLIKGREKRRVGLAFSIAGLLTAACIAGVVVIISINNPIWPVDEPIRSSVRDVQKLIDEEKYDEALILVEKELYSADSILKELRKNENMGDEETQYEIKFQESRIQELTEERDALKKKLK